MNTMQIGAAQVASRGTASLVEPEGGIERLAAAGIEMPDWQIEKIRRNAGVLDSELLTIRLFPVHNDGSGNIYGAGRCPWCNLIHGHGIDGETSRRPHCSDRLPPFSEHFPKSDAYAVQTILDVAPKDIHHELGLGRQDLLNTAAMLLDRRRRFTRKRWRVALQALVRCRVLDDAIAAEMARGRTEGQARRNALAAAWRRHGPGPMRKRLADALLAAYEEAGRLNGQ